MVVLVGMGTAHAEPAYPEEPEMKERSAAFRAARYSHLHGVIAIAITRNPDLPYSHELIIARYRQIMGDAAKRHPEAAGIMDHVKFFTEDRESMPQATAFFFYRLPYGPFNLVEGGEKLKKLVQDYADWQYMDREGPPGTQ